MSTDGHTRPDGSDVPPLPDGCSGGHRDDDGEWVFLKCADCGGWFRAGTCHGCGPLSITATDRQKSKEALDLLLEADSGDPDDIVIHVSGNKRSAYHKPEDPDDPTVGTPCPSNLVRPESEWVRSTRAEAQSRDLFPCRRCYPDVASKAGTLAIERDMTE